MSSSPSHLAQRIAMEHEKTAERLAQLEEELMGSGNQSTNDGNRLNGNSNLIINARNDFENDEWIFGTNNDSMYNDNEQLGYNDVVYTDKMSSMVNINTTSNSSSIIPPSPLRSKKGNGTSRLQQDLEQMQEDVAGVEEVEEMEQVEKVEEETLVPKTQRQRYTIPTTTSLSRQRLATEKSLEILKRKQIRSEQKRLDLVIRKGQVDDELNNAIKQIKQLKLQNSTLLQENQNLRSKLSTSKIEKEQLRQAMVHASDVAKKSRSSGNKRYLESEDRLLKCRNELSSLRATNARLIHVQESYSHQNDMILKLEEDKMKLTTSLTKTRKSLTAERNVNSTMSKLRYDNELLKHENKDLKKFNSTNTKLLKSSRLEIVNLQDQLSKFHSKINSSENANLRRMKTRMSKIENVLRNTRLSLSTTLSRLNNFLLVSSKPLLTSTSIIELAHIVETLGSQTMIASICELWGFSDNENSTIESADGLQRIISSSTYSSPTFKSINRDVKNIVREAYVTQDIVQLNNIIAAPIFDETHHHVIGVLWCCRSEKSTTNSLVASPSFTGLSRKANTPNTPLSYISSNTVLTPTTETSNSTSSNNGDHMKKKVYNTCDVVCLRQLVTFIGYAIAYTKIKTTSKENLTRVRNLLMDIQKSSSATKDEMLNELTKLKNINDDVNNIKIVNNELETTLNSVEYQLSQEKVRSAQTNSKLDRLTNEYKNIESELNLKSAQYNSMENQLYAKIHSYETGINEMNEKNTMNATNTIRVYECISELVNTITPSSIKRRNTDDAIAGVVDQNTNHPMKLLTTTIENMITTMVSCDGATVWLTSTNENGVKKLQKWNSNENIIVEYDGSLGIVGSCFTTKRIINVTERASNDPRYESSVDLSNIHMNHRAIKTICCVPIFENGNIEGITTATNSNNNNNVVGVIEVFNKNTNISSFSTSSSSNVQRKDGSWKISFDQEDINVLLLLCNYLNIACCYVHLMLTTNDINNNNQQSIQKYQDQLDLLISEKNENKSRNLINATLAFISKGLISMMNEDQEDEDERPTDDETVTTTSKGAMTMVHQLFALSSEGALTLVSSVRATLFILNKENGSLWSFITNGQRISVPSGQGFAGLCVSTGLPVKVDDCQNDPRFGGDKEIGFTTRCVLCCPVLDAKGNIYGCLQVINKSSGNDNDYSNNNVKCFNHQDQLTLTEFALKVGPVVQSWMGKWACIVFCLLN
jgi:hypothetical protein